MNKFSERDLDNLAAILDYCDRIDIIVKRFGNTIEQFRRDADFRDASMMNIFEIIWNIIANDIPKLRKEITSKTGLV